jgi:hypothetical protein
VSKIFYDLIKSKIKNRPIENNILIGTVSSLNPLRVTIIPGDTAVPAVSTTNLNGIVAGSRIVLQKMLNQYIAIAILGNPAIQLYRCTANQNLTTADMANIAGMVFTIPKNSGYYAINTHINVRNETSATPDVKFDWAITGTDYYTIVGRNCRGGEYAATNSTTLTLTRNSAGHGFTTDVYYPLPAVNGNSYVTEQFIVLAGVSDTIFQFRGSQVSADAAKPTVVSGYSHIIVNRLSMGA